MSINAVLSEIDAFLGCPTPQSWIDAALKNQKILLIDHANCEKKAATTGMTLLYKYTHLDDLLHKMSQLAREELLHFEQVLDIMRERGIRYRHLNAGAYAGKLHEKVRKGVAEELIDILIIGAFIEARSCERFAKLAPYLDEQLAKFYRSLLRSEGRHYQDYLSLAAQYSKEPIAPRVAEFREWERALIEGADPIFRFHSGVPVSEQASIGQHLNG